ncbi:hypothetical protein LOD99_8946 [Oopsacas minuta]|uniref:Uncharacterized protein n=1 Tax=Oopsacas minuta TaxID=111878 RepID=A0AAV7JE15_9METZ|nr:hypothetical protein LOD99_8946 [Oopsacas minuta]
MNLLLTSCLLILSLCQVDTTYAPQRVRLDYPSNGRPDSPYRTTLPCYNKNLTQMTPCGGNDYINTARHHVDPWSTIRTFWNSVIMNSNHTSNGMSTVWTQYIKLYPQADVDTDPNVIPLVKGIQAGTIVHDATAQYPEGYEDFMQFLAWLPGNLFIGPQDRSDDPGDGFETTAYVVIGRIRWGYLQKTYDYMKIYRNTDSVSTVKKNMLQLASAINGIIAPYPLKGQNWERNSNGTYRLKT